MNYMILSSYDSMVKSSVMIISDEKMSYAYLSEDEINMLKNECGCWFDMGKVKDYLWSHDLIPCNVIKCSDGDIDMTYVGKYSR